MKEDWKFFWGSAGLLAATTIGAGIFSLPYVFNKAGWLTGVFYLAVLSGILIYVHYLYWRALTELKEKNRLLGLIKNYLGEKFFYFGLATVVGGLTLTLVVYLVLSSQFLKLIFPTISLKEGILVFWLLASLPLAWRLPWLVFFEFSGTLLMAGIIVLVLINGWGKGIGSAGVPAFNFDNIFLPFGAVLFSLAGWTAIEPIFDWKKKLEDGYRPPNPNIQMHLNVPNRFKKEAVESKIGLSGLAAGTLIPAFLYLVFVLGILGSAGEITPDTLSGLTNWQFWKLASLGWLGLLAILTSYVPIALEIKNSLTKDLGWNAGWSTLAVVFSPLVLVVLGLRSFFSVVSLAGGIFLGLQYLLIILVAKKILSLDRFQKIFLNVLAAVFILAAVYEAYHFLIR